MRLALVLRRPAANQTGVVGLWQDPVRGYWEQHGKTEFKSGENYGLSTEEKQAVLDRFLMKEALKKESLRLEYDPIYFRYRTGMVIDPAVFRWYAMDMTEVEHFRYTPKSVFVYFGMYLMFFFLYTKMQLVSWDRNNDQCRTGKILWWDRRHGRFQNVCGIGPFDWDGYDFF